MWVNYRWSDSDHEQFIYNYNCGNIKTILLLTIDVIGRVATVIQSLKSVDPPLHDVSAIP